jgi:hypothetical protein
MPISYKGITPVVLIDTNDLQSTTEVAKVGHPGICMTLVCFWLSRLVEGNPVTSIDEFPNRFQLTIAQSAYVFSESKGQKAQDELILGRFGIKATSYTKKKKKWYMWGNKRLGQIASAVAGWPGYYIFGALGDGGHALGIRTSGAAQFFDPNEGVLGFNSSENLAKWLPAYMSGEYPDLRKSVELYGIGLE